VRVGGDSPARVDQDGINLKIGEDDQGDGTRQILSSIYVNGMSGYYRCADVAVFGFQYERPAHSQRACRATGCAVPRSASLADRRGGPAIP
jgi:hypothetical protein